jgi:hypothetical protein
MVAHKASVTHIEAAVETAKENSNTPDIDHKLSIKPKIKVSVRGWNWWKALWAFLGPIFGFITLYSNFTPAISIVPGPNLDKTQAYSTQIVITNTGRVPVYDLWFSCGLGVSSGPMYIQHLEAHPRDDLAPVQRLSPGQPTTKACAVASDVQGRIILNFTVNFKWPLIGWLLGWQDSKNAKFDVKEGRDGHFLVPSASPWP